MRRLYWRIRQAPSRWRARHKNATCMSCGYSTHQGLFRHWIGWTACPACWEEGGILVRYTKAGIS